MKKNLKKVSILLTLVLVVVAFANEKSSDAHSSLGCKWGSSNVKFTAPTVLADYNKIVNAAGRWSGVDAKYTKVTDSTYNVYATAEARGNTVIWTGVTRKHGTTESAPSCSNGKWYSSTQVNPVLDVVLNYSLANTLKYTDDQKTGVLAHEFGHALGLAHNSATLSSGSPVAIMYPYDSERHRFSITKPQADDKGGINAIY